MKAAKMVVCALIILQTLSMYFKKERKRDRAGVVHRDMAGETEQKSCMRSEVKTCKDTKNRRDNSKEENRTVNTDTGVLFGLHIEIAKLDSMTVSMFKR